MPARPLGPDEIRNVQLTRGYLGRKGYAAEEVDSLLDRIAAEVAIMNGYCAELVAENVRLKAALRDWNGRNDGGGADHPVANRRCPANNTIIRRLDAAQRSTRRIGEYVGGHYARVHQAASDHQRDGADAGGPQAAAMEIWLSWAQAVLTELDDAQAQIRAVRKIMDGGCALPKAAEDQ
ncbi:MAG: DivIVA domain-containing protein [Dactylosporangium sp.]|nr:DivIVA domain-containing protein [Dactylosporangium sp.]NNJ61672.1 DivIVA domain-containing protein [Dactylosporangium sp.]